MCGCLPFEIRHLDHHERHEPDDDDADGADRPLPHGGLSSTRRVRGGDVPEAAFALTEVERGLSQVIRTEIWPKYRREVELGVRRLPDQKIAHPDFARGADDQVRIGHFAGIEHARNGLLVDLVRGDPARRPMPLADFEQRVRALVAEAR